MLPDIYIIHYKCDMVNAGTYSGAGKSDPCESRYTESGHYYPQRCQERCLWR